MNTHKRWIACALGMGVLVLGGCTTQPRRVSCEEQLEPINVPAPKLAETQGGRSLQPGSAKAQVGP